MRLEEALEQCTETVSIGIRVDGREARIHLSEEIWYWIEENRPWIVGPSHIIEEYLTKEEVRVRVSDISFASEMDPKGWMINPHTV